MPDPSSRAARYRQRAIECRRLASTASNDYLRAEYEKLAIKYEDIADAELKIEEAEKKAN